MPELIPHPMDLEPAVPLTTESCQCHEDVLQREHVETEACQCHLNADRLPLDDRATGTPVAPVMPAPPLADAAQPAAGLFDSVASKIAVAVLTLGALGVLSFSLIPGVFVVLMLLLVGLSPFLVLIAGVLFTRGVGRGPAGNRTTGPLAR